MSELLGKTVGQYQLVAEIVQTVNTLVYKGFQPVANRYVAVKILKPSVAHSPEAVQRFRQEGDLLVQFRHPRMLEVYETGEAEGLIFRAARLAENGSLGDRLAVGPQNPFYETSRLILLFQEIVEGLEFLHAQGYIHGNLKPSNVLLDAMLHPLLSDYGLPGRPGDAGSPYMAPEQVQGGAVDRRADVYALGVLLYTTLVGVAPPAGVVVSPRSRRPELPESVERVIFKAMAQNPDQRFQSAAEFFNAMRTALAIPARAPQPVYAPAPPPPAAPMPTVSQTVTVEGQKKGTNWVGIILMVFLALALCIGAIFVYQVYMQNQSATPGEPTQPVVQPTQAPGVTLVLPTQEPRPTQPPAELPTNPPEQPTLPPEQPAQPPEQPTPPPEQPPQVEQPIASPPQDTPGAGSPLCGSLGLIAAPMIVLGASYITKKHRP